MSAERPQKVFISRTSKGLSGIAEKAAAVLRGRGMEVIIQSEFRPHWASVRQMLQDRLKDCDAAICLIGPVHGGEPDDAISGLKDSRTEGKHFSFTQLEFLVARDLGRAVFTFVVGGAEIVEPYETEAPELAARQQQFITDFAKDERTLYYDYTDAAKLLDEIGEMEIPRTALAGKPANLPYASLGSLFKGRDEFLEQLRTQLTCDAAAIIKGHRTIHGMGGVGKTRAAIEYAWRNTEKYNALLFVSADSPQALQRNLANLCGPLVLNLPEQNEKDQNLQVEAALKWLALHPGWFLIIDNVDTEDAALETKALLERLSTGHVIITSRISEWKGEVKALDLDVLSDAASIEFLNERTAERRAQQPDDDAIVARLVRVLDCLALALEQAGALISHERLSYVRYLEMWESARPNALAWHDEEKMKYPRSLAVTYETSVAQLSSAAQEFFRQLSWLAPDPLPLSTFATLPDPADARRQLGELDSLHLVRFQKDGKSFAIHRLVQEITRQKQGTVSTPTLGERPVKKRRGFFSRLFGGKEGLPSLSSSVSSPPTLCSALRWINGLFTGEPVDVRTWPVLDPIASHAQTVAFFADVHGIPDPTSRLMSQVAVLFQAKAQYQTAELLVRRALAIDEAYHDTSHPDVAKDIGNLAALCYRTGRIVEAEPLMRRALAIVEASYGKDHREVATQLNNLAQLLHATNRLVEAELLTRRALAIERKNKSNSAQTLAVLAQVLHDTNRLMEAEPLLRSVLAMNEANYPKDHPQVGASLSNLAQLLKATSRLAEAEPLMRRSLEIFEKSFGDNHPDVAVQLNNLAMLLQAMNRLAEAEPLMRRALAIDETKFGNTHPAFVRDTNNLAMLFYHMRRFAEAEPLMRQVAVLTLKFPKQAGHLHPFTMQRLVNYDILRQAMGDVSAGPAILSLGAEAGMPEAQFREILAQAFGG